MNKSISKLLSGNFFNNYEPKEIIAAAFPSLESTLKKLEYTFQYTKAWALVAPVTLTNSQLKHELLNKSRQEFILSIDKIEQYDEEAVNGFSFHYHTDLPYAWANVVFDLFPKKISSIDVDPSYLILNARVFHYDDAIVPPMLQIIDELKTTYKSFKKNYLKRRGELSLVKEIKQEGSLSVVEGGISLIEK